MGCLRAETFSENLKHLNNFFRPQQNFESENYLLKKLLLAPSGAQGVTMSQVCLNLTSALLAYFVRQTKAKIICLVS